MIKEEESMTRQINIMDISKNDLVIEIESQHLSDIVSISDNKFTLKPGQTKTVNIDFNNNIKEKNIEHEPGIYVGNILIKSGSYVQKIPAVVEIETKGVLFDINVEIPVRQKNIKQGERLEVQIDIFNLKKIGLTSVDMHYCVRDIAGNTIITENDPPHTKV